MDFEPSQTSEISTDKAFAVYQMKHFIYLGDLEKCNGTFTEPVCVKEVKDIGALSFRSEKTVKRYCAEKDNSLIILPDGECAEKSYILDEKVNTYHNRANRTPALY